MPPFCGSAPGGRSPPTGGRTGFGTGPAVPGGGGGTLRKAYSELAHQQIGRNRDGTGRFPRTPHTRPRPDRGGSGLAPNLFSGRGGNHTPSPRIEFRLMSPFPIGAKEKGRRHFRLVFPGGGVPMGKKQRRGGGRPPPPPCARLAGGRGPPRPLGPRRVRKKTGHAATQKIKRVGLGPLRTSRRATNTAESVRGAHYGDGDSGRLNGDRGSPGISPLVCGRWTDPPTDGIFRGGGPGAGGGGRGIGAGVGGPGAPTTQEKAARGRVG
jgi:hypothetical protein